MYLILSPSAAGIYRNHALPNSIKAVWQILFQDVTSNQLKQVLFFKTIFRGDYHNAIE